MAQTICSAVGGRPGRRDPTRRRQARWMGPVMVVLAGMSAIAPAAAEVVEIPEWRKAFAAQGVGGTVAVRRLGEERSFVSDLDGAGHGLTPAATFKTPLLLIALETGVVGGPGQESPSEFWSRPDDAWNGRRSVDPAARVTAIAREIGAERMAAWLIRLGYGNASVAGGIDRFWLDGGLTVSPEQQLDFVQRLLLGTLPASTRAQVAARTAVPAEHLACDTTLRGATGWASPHGDDGPGVGWWIGWVERPREVWLFATAVEGHPERMRDARRAVTLSVLDRLGIGPEDMSSETCGGRIAALPPAGSTGGPGD